MKKAMHNVFLAALCLIAGTTQAQKLSRTDLASFYSEYNFTSPEPLVYHDSDDTSRVFINISLHHFVYAPVGSGSREARFRVTHKLYPSYNSKNPLEHGSRTYSDTLFGGEEMDMAIEVRVGAAFPGTYVLYLEIEDLNRRGNIVRQVVDIQKVNRYTSQNFYLTDDESYPHFGRFIRQESYFRIRYRNPETEQLHIRYYNREFPIARPPFAMDRNVTYSFEPDSIYTIPLEDGLSELLELPYPGIYHVQADLSRPDGLTLFRFDEGFPEVNIPAMALAPLRYLTTEQEFEHLLEYRDYKAAVDSFWLERASYDPDRAKNMIRKFYQRVVDVNYLFSSYQEGWKTDRGLIYIIYGPPSEVYRRDEEEEWIYGERGNPMSIRFYFLRMENPFTNNDFSLQRSPIYKTSWFVAVENWRR